MPGTRTYGGDTRETPAPNFAELYRLMLGMIFDLTEAKVATSDARLADQREPLAGSVTDAKVSAAAVLRNYTVGPTRRNVMAHPLYDANAANNGPAIQARIDEGPGTVSFPANFNGRTSQTIHARSNVSLDGDRGGIVPGSGLLANGSQFLWTGAAGGTVVDAVGVHHHTAKGMGIDGGGISNVRGLLIDSDSDLSTEGVTWEQFYVQRCGNGTDSGVAIAVGQDRVTSFQNDKVELRRGWVFACAKGVLLDSDNAMNGGGIYGVTFVSTNRAIDILACGQMEVASCIQGALLGSSPVFIRFGDRWNPVVVRSCQTEGVGGTSLLVAASPTLVRPLTLIGNSFALAVDGASPVVDITSLCRVLSLGNHFHQFCRATTAGTVIDSYGDTFGSGGWANSPGVLVTPRLKGFGDGVWTPGTIPAGETAHTYLAVTAAQGDAAQAGFSAMAVGLTLSACVVGTNVVQVSLTNTTGSSIVVGAGTAMATVTEF